VYLALPKIYASTIDGAIIQGQGVGLIVYDEKTIEEVIAPKFFQHQASKSQENHAEEIEQLRSHLTQLEQTVQILKCEISQLKSIRPIEETTKTQKTESVPESLPSFFRDNAWLDILSKRGKEPERYVS